MGGSSVAKIQQEELSAILAEYVVNLDAKQIPQEVINFTKGCVLDWLGSAIGGMDKPPIRMLAETVNLLGGTPQATSLVGGRTSVTNAALINGAASHVIELDDIHKSSIIHAGTVVIPAALAVAEWKGSSGLELLAAIIAGYEVCYRIGEAVSPSHYIFWHNTATCGTFGAAVAAAKLMGLNKEQIIHTLGSAGTQAAGLWEFIEEGAMSKQLHTGKAAMNGVFSALISSQGFTAASRILEGKRGFIAAMSKQTDFRKITEDIGKIYKITENSFKIHASCRHTHSAVDLILDINQEHDFKNDNDILLINIRTYQTALDITDNPQPQSVYAAKFSLQFCAALAAVKGSAGLTDFNEESLYDYEIRTLMKRINVGVDSKMDKAYPKDWGARISIEFADGTVKDWVTSHPKGDPENPITLEYLQQKFIKITHQFGMTTEKQQDWLKRVMELDKLHNMDHFFPAGGVL